ncbi:MAG: hypothetical protein PWQ78_512 [Petrotoga sp.]|jgi:hypothetical protein|uniref:hypothetical protein n=1 Tax=Petrotoga mobilis TaxID=69499 RepID=UPI000304D494|nr:hypothetical protein [Petrotoga mobilis]MDK2812302.1 hypothetical protein [Petrotoga sp.]MDK2906575.1 hypothetical protein [Petrotoga sp.]
MDISALEKYMKKNKEVDILELKEKFHLNQSELNILIPFLRSMNVGMEKIDKIEPVCKSCPLTDKCGKGLLNNCYYTK